VLKHGETRDARVPRAVAVARSFGAERNHAPRGARLQDDFERAPLGLVRGLRSTRFVFVNLVRLGNGVTR
jgi:hypothetical protein